MTRIITFFSISLLWLYVSFSFAETEVAKHLSRFLLDRYPTYEILTGDNLNKGVSNYYNEKYRGQHPGYACGQFRGASGSDCGVLLIEKGKSSEGVKLLLIISNINLPHPYVSYREDYGNNNYYNNYTFIRFLVKGVIPDRETGIPVEMPGDGIEVVLYGKSSIAYFWDGAGDSKAGSRPRAGERQWTGRPLSLDSEVGL